MKKQEAIRTVVAALYNVSDEVADTLNPHPLIWNNHNALIGALKHGLISMGQCTQQEWDSAWGDEDKCQAPSHMKLEKGKQYDISSLRVTGWTGEHEGYNYGYYFQDGIYLGPDEHGVEPLFEEL